ncbi:hypothetical protein [Aeromonas allosaccharophila]
MSQLSYTLSADPEAALRRSGHNLPSGAKKSVIPVLNQGDSGELPGTASCTRFTPQLIVK